jgi:hypothetical protein
MNRIAAGIEAKIVLGDVPSIAEPVEQVCRIEAAADELAERFLDRVRVAFESGAPATLSDVAPSTTCV